MEIRVRLEDKVLRVFARRSQTYASNTHIFLLWMVGSSLVLIGIAVAFLRNQIRPILRLAEAAESFGKGRPTPSDFRPRGAEEVRRAGAAFIQMRERIERQIEQRTAMLTGVSHDLRTILTRFKLQLAFLDGPEVESLNRDVEDMQSMLEGYLAFARSEAEEDLGRLDLRQLLAKVEENAALHERKVEIELEGNPWIKVRPNAFTRLVDNLAGNAFRYADSVKIRAVHGPRWLTVTVDDDGPGLGFNPGIAVVEPYLGCNPSGFVD